MGLFLAPSPIFRFHFQVQAQSLVSDRANNGAPEKVRVKRVTELSTTNWRLIGLAAQPVTTNWPEAALKIKISIILFLPDHHFLIQGVELRRRRLKNSSPNPSRKRVTELMTSIWCIRRPRTDCRPFSSMLRKPSAPPQSTMSGTRFGLMFLE